MARRAGSALVTVFATRTTGNDDAEHAQEESPRRAGMTGLKVDVINLSRSMVYTGGERVQNGGDHEMPGPVGT